MMKRGVVRCDEGMDEFELCAVKKCDFCVCLWEYDQNALTLFCCSGVDPNDSIIHRAPTHTQQYEFV